MKNKYFKTTLFISLLLFTKFAYASGIPVFDFDSFIQLARQYEVLRDLFKDMERTKESLSTLEKEDLKWGTFDFFKYAKGLNNISKDIEKTNEIISTSVEKYSDGFEQLYPGFNGSSLRNYVTEYKERSDKLLKILSNQVSVANEALANQKDINSSEHSSAAAVANLTLASLSNLNSQISSEIRTANAYRANQTQNDIDEKIELQSFIGETYKKHDSSRYKTCVGECS